MDEVKRNRIATRVARSVTANVPMMADFSNTSFAFSGHNLPPEVMGQLEQNYNAARDQWSRGGVGEPGVDLEDIKKEHPAFIHHEPLQEGDELESGHYVQFMGAPVEHEGRTLYPGLAAV